MYIYLVNIAQLVEHQIVVLRVVGSCPIIHPIGKDSIFVWCSTGHRALLVGLNEKPSARGCA